MVVSAALEFPVVAPDRRGQVAWSQFNHHYPALHTTSWRAINAGTDYGWVRRATRLAIAWVMHRSDGEERIDFFIRVHAWVGEPHNAEPEKCTDLAWFRLDARPENIVPYVYKALQNYKANKWFDSYGF